MATQSSRVKFRKPERGAGGAPNDPVNIVIDWNQSMDRADDGVGWPNYTSSTHTSGSSLYDGKCEYETDTGLLAVWDANASTWRKYPIDGFAKGRVGSTSRSSDTASQTSASGEQGPHMSITFTAESDRRYWVEYFVYLEQDAGTEPANCAIRMRFASGGAVTTAGTLIGAESLANITDTPGREADFHKIYEFVPAINGTVTVGLFVIVTSAGGDSVHVEANGTNNLCTMIVRDMGV